MGLERWEAPILLSSGETIAYLCWMSNHIRGSTARQLKQFPWETAPERLIVKQKHSFGRETITAGRVPANRKTVIWTKLQASEEKLSWRNMLIQLDTSPFGLGSTLWFWWRPGDSSLS